MRRPGASRRQPSLPSRSHAIRELVIQALDAADAPKNEPKNDKKV
jgi:hypothetical protein